MSGKPPKSSSQDKKGAAAKDNPRSMESYLRPEVIQQVSRLDLRARFIVEGFLSGLHGSPFQGFSVEFSEHRKYTPGDDIKDIDWNVYAKTEKYYVKKFKAEPPALRPAAKAPTPEVLSWIKSRQIAFAKMRKAA